MQARIRKYAANMLKSRSKASSSTTSASPNCVLQLQTIIGNRAVRQLIQTSNTPELIAASAPKNALLSAPSPKKKKRPVPFTLKMVSEKTNYYDVEGDTLRQVAGQLQADWGSCEVVSNTDYEATNGVITRVTVNVGITYTMPRWKGKTWKKASLAVKNEWNNMIKVLWVHEKGHRQVGVTYLEGLEPFLVGTPEKDMQVQAAKMQTEHQTKQNEYDQQTDKGKNQGLSLDYSVK